MINLVSALSKGLDKKEDNWNEGKIHVSDLGCSSHIPEKDRKCPRQFWLRYNGYDREALKPGVQLMFEQGHALEKKAINLIMNGFEGSWNIVGTQINISNGLPGIAGRLDILISDGKEYCVVDVKTRRGGFFRYNNDIKLTNKFQIGGYIYSLNNMLSKRVNNGKVIEIDREGQNFAVEHDFLYTKEFEGKIRNSILEIKKTANQKVPPAAMKPKTKINKNKGPDSVNVDLPWQCKYCDYRGVSCSGAIPPKFDDKLGKVCGHIKEGKFAEKIEGISEYVEVS